MEKLEMDKKIVTMCCGGKKCPVLSADDRWIEIADDFGGTIKIPRKHATAFKAALEEVLR